jgi:UDPglucose 6-dehydrogenase
VANVAIIGSGRVGLTTGACLAHLGHRVVCADSVAWKVALLSHGGVPIVEAGLDDLVREGLEAGRLSFVVGGARAVRDAEFTFLCVPTPEGVAAAPDLRYVREATQTAAPYLPSGSVVVNKSTAPVGTVHLVEHIIGRRDVSVVANPEFLREGSAVDDWLHPDRIILGGDDPEALDRVARLFEVLGAPIVRTDPVSAETIKYSANAFLATKVTFVNAIANFCEAVGADVRDVVRGIGLDSRIGPGCLNPGPGWGGSCLLKDTHAVVRMAADAGYDFDLLRAVIDANRWQHEAVVAKVERMLGGSATGTAVAVWGLAFKAGTDDMSGSPAVAIIDELAARGAVIRAYDPAVADPVDGARAVDDPYEACRGADVLLILTDWPEFCGLDLDVVRDLMRRARMVDARNLFDPVAVTAAGFEYDGIGLPTAARPRRAAFGADPVAGRPPA